ncbi:MAG: hypothetical protein E6R14_02405 [Thermomicrobiales bacterium]|nr:MAG: hypothetical protein E6R14_02405 [Thermomicrobiales bacterium]
MTTRADLRASLRIRLEDPTPAPLWSDVVLHDFLREALYRFSARFPLQQTESVVAIGGELLLPLSGPSSERDIVSVRLPGGDLLPHAVAGDSAAGWSFWNGALALTVPAAAGTWRIDYLALRSLPDDDVTPVELTDGDAEILVLMAASGALLRRSVEVGKRGLDTSSLALVRVAEAYERSAESLIRARFRRAVGGTLQIS